MSGWFWSATAVASFGAATALRARDGSVAQVLGISVSVWGFLGLAFVGAFALARSFPWPA